MEEIIRKITIASLTALKEKKISTIQAVKNQIPKEKTASERFRLTSGSIWMKALFTSI